MSRLKNILLVHVDQLRADVCGVYGSRLGLTPHLDYFARQGVAMMNHCTVNPVCTPNRACMLTGQYCTTHGIWRNGKGLRPNQRTLATDLAEAGLRTAWIGKWHLGGYRDELPDGHSFEEFDNWMQTHPDHNGPVPAPFRGGFQDWLGAETPDLFDDPWDTVLWDENDEPHRFPGHRIDAYTDCAIRYLSEHSEQPFCLAVSYLEPHHQNNQEWYAAVPALEEVCRDLQIPGELEALKHLRPEVQSRFAGYCANVRKLDEAFGRLLDALRSLGLEEDTLVVFTTDHGDHFKTRVDNDDNKRTCHDSVTRIPCILRGGPFRGGLRLDALTSTMDLFPTFLDLFGIQIPACVDGHSFLGLVDQGAWAEREEVLMQIWGTRGPERALRTKKYKICVRNPDGNWWSDFGGPDYEPVELYDVQIDPYELDNKINHPNYRAIQRKLLQRLAGAMIAAGEARFSINASGNKGMLE
jgi:arylsulfatase A-like enzyme